MTSVCAKCVHFRRARPLSALLQAAFAEDTEGAEVAGALSKITDDEQKVRDAEADLKGKEGSADHELWGARPLMSDYCGLREADETYFIAEVKNRDMACTDFAAGKAERHTCETCAHRVPAPGRAADHEREQVYTKMINDAVAVQGSPQAAQGMLQSYRAGEISRKALELSSAYAAKGRLLSQPAYLDHCSALSTDGEYVVCALQNTHATCSTWEKGPEMSAVSTEVVAAGPPPLTRQAVSASIDLLDFIAAVVRGVDTIDVTPDLRERWVAYVVNYYAMLNPADRYWFATADMSLGQLQAAWPQMIPEQRAMYQQVWAQPLQQLLQFATPVLGAAAAPPEQQVTFTQSPAYAQSQPSDLMSQIQAQQQAAAQQAYQQGGAPLQQQVQMQNDAVNMQMLSNMSQMRYQSMMAVAKNMKY